MRWAFIFDGVEWAAPLSTYAHMPPAVPGNFEAQFIGEGLVTFRWEPALSSLPRERYELRLFRNGQLFRQVNLGAAATSYTRLIGSAPGPRVAQLRAVNSVGAGVESTITFVIPTVPGPAREVTAQTELRAQSVFVTISWLPPAGAEYNPITLYEILRNFEAASSASFRLSGNATAFSDVVEYGRRYVYEIYPYNILGSHDTDSRALVTVDTPPTTVGNVQLAGIEYHFLSAATARYTISFDPADTHLPWTRYYMYLPSFLLDGSPDSRRHENPGGAPSPSLFITRYRNLNDVYAISIQAYNAAGGGPMAVFTVGGVPPQGHTYSYTAPSGFTAVFNNGGVEFSWDIGSANLGCFGTYSQFQLNGSAPNSHIANIPCSQFNPATKRHYYTIASPGGYGKGGFRLRSRTYSGNQLGPWVTAFVSAPPAAPVLLASAPGIKQITLGWRGPPSGSQITRYDLFYDNVSISISGQNIQFIDLLNGVYRASLEINHVVDVADINRQYRFTMRAVNAAGAGLPATITASPIPGATLRIFPRDVTLGRFNLIVARPAPNPACVVGGFAIQRN